MSTTNHNRNEDQYLSGENENKNEGDAKVDHSFTENAEPDYANDLINEEFHKEGFNKENLGQEDHSEKLDNSQLGKELGGLNTGDEFDNEQSDNEIPDLDQENEQDYETGSFNEDNVYEDQEGTNPNRKL
jgi:hypothetical protein